MPSMIYLMLRSAHKGRFEARTTPMQALIRGLRQVLHNLSGEHLLERLQGVGFADGFVPADAMDARETHRQPRFVARRTMHAVERDFEDDFRCDLEIAFD